MRMPKMTRSFAAFGAGIALWEATVHGALLLSRQRPKILGIQLTDRLNLVQAIVPALVAIILGRYAFSLAMRPLSGEDFVGEVAT